MLYLLLEYLHLIVIIRHFQRKDGKLKRKQCVRLCLSKLTIKKNLFAYHQQNYQPNSFGFIGICSKYLVFLRFPWCPEFQNSTVQV